MTRSQSKVPVTQTELAGAANLSRNSVGTMLQRLRTISMVGMMSMADLDHLTHSPRRRRMSAICAQRPSRISGAERSHSAGASTGFGLRPGSSCRRHRRRAAEEREAATGQARGFLHCGGQRFKSSPLHQEVPANRSRFQATTIPRLFRALARKPMVCRGLSCWDDGPWPAMDYSRQRPAADRLSPSAEAARKRLASLTPTQSNVFFVSPFDQPANRTACARIRASWGSSE